ncbi:MAG: DUF4445 domain-containing protein [Dehalococcoidales bacterium]|nr:DUF4445 domain-containing protein [Dehalococcoidales bacterium]
MGNSQAEAKFNVHFLPDDIVVTVNQGTDLLSAALQAGVHINASCAGAGTCHTCKIRVSRGTVESKQEEKLSSKEYDQGMRLACQSLVLSDLIVVIPPESRLDKAVQADERQKSSGVAAAGWRYNPPLNKYYLELPPATVRDNANDLFRLMWGMQQSYDLNDLTVNIDIIRKLPFVLRENNWKITVTTTIISSRPFTKAKITPRIVNLEPGDTRSRLYAAVVDIGTTSICAQLVDINRGKVTAGAVTLNKQVAFGEDISSRIVFSQKKGGLKKLQDAVIESINTALDELLDSSGVNREDISHITVAGNPVMEHLLLGLDPKFICLSPYTPIANFLPAMKATSLGLNVGEHVYVFTFPAISGYVGGDVISGVIACGMHQTKKQTLYFDIGSNAKVVAGNSEWMVAASCFAGPVLEGRGIVNGMLPVKGAIRRCSLDPKTLEPRIEVIEGEKPAGICGAGLISAVAAFLEHGVIDQQGKFSSSSSSPGIRRGQKGLEYVLVPKEDSASGKDIVITEPDIDLLIRAKAAVYAAFQTLSHGLDNSSLNFEQIILACNCGDNFDIEGAVTIGLLPDLPGNRFVFVGNASLTGGRLVNFSNDMLIASRKVAQTMTNIELNDNSDFNNNYVPALRLPHTDEKAFPSVMKKLPVTYKNHRNQ